jgi:hypothetical protein
MPETPASHPLFDKCPGRSHGTTLDREDWFGLPTDDEECKQLRDLSARLRKRLPDNRVVFQPQLLIRTFAGDNGVRPYGGVFWESPDIWLAPGDPAGTPPVPPAPGGIAVAGTPNTLYAHVWNLGMAPIAGALVEFLVFNPSLTFEGQTPLFRGVTRVDLAGRSNPYECHKLVKCPTAWVPTFVNDGHECVIARVSGVGDPLGPGPFEPAVNRHVGQRNVMVAPYAQDLESLMSQLLETLPSEAELRFWQAGPEAQPLVQLSRRTFSCSTTTSLARSAPVPYA